MNIGSLSAFFHFSFYISIVVLLGLLNPSESFKLINHEAAETRTGLDVDLGLGKRSSGTSYANVKWNDNWNDLELGELLRENFEFTLKEFKLDYENVRDVVFGADSHLWIHVSDDRNNNNNRVLRLSQDTDRLVQISGLDHVDAMFLNKFNKKIIVFNDKLNRKLFLSNDNGLSVYQKDVPFQVDAIYFTPDESLLLAAQISINDNNHIWLSVDFGRNWILLGERVKKIPEWSASGELSYLHYIENEHELIEMDIVGFKSKRAQNVNDFKVKLRQDVMDFAFINDFLVLVGSNNGKISLEMGKVTDGSWIFKQAKLNDNRENSKQDYIDFRVLWNDKTEMYIGAFTQINSEIQIDLYRSNDFENFQLSLENLNYNADLDWIEFRALNKKGGVFLANVKSEKKEKITMVKKSNDSKWTAVTLEPELNAYMNLNDKRLSFSHEYEQSSFMDPKSPDFLISSAIQNEATSPHVYASKADAEYWYEILTGNFMYTYAYYGNLLIAIEKAKPVNELIVSYNKGVDWKRLKFSQELVLVNEMHKEPVEDKARFILFATNPLTNSKSIIRLSSFENECPLKCKANTSEICLNYKTVCNGRVECDDGSDELKCATTDIEQFYPQVHFYDLENLFRLKIVSKPIENNNLHLVYSIEFTPSNSGLSLNSYVIQLIGRDKSRDQSLEHSLAEFKRSEPIGSVDFLNLNASYIYECSFFANTTESNGLIRMLNLKPTLKFQVEESVWSLLEDEKKQEDTVNVEENANLVGLLLVLSLVSLIILSIVVLTSLILKFLLKKKLLKSKLAHLSKTMNQRPKNVEYREYLISPCEDDNLSRVYNSPVF